MHREDEMSATLRPKSDMTLGGEVNISDVVAYSVTLGHVDSLLANQVRTGGKI